MAVTVEDVRQHLNYEFDQDLDDAELESVLASAVGILTDEAGTIDQDDPAMRWAILCQVQDMWRTQRGQQSNDDELAPLLGFEAISPYVRSLLRPALRVSRAPSGTFPVAPCLPDPPRYSW